MSAQLDDEVALRAIVAAQGPELEGAHPFDVLAWAGETFGPGLVVASSMGDEVLVHLAGRAVPGVDVIFLDTGYHFAETIGTRDAYAETTDITLRTILPLRTVAEQDAEHGEEGRLDREGVRTAHQRLPPRRANTGTPRVLGTALDRRDLPGFRPGRLHRAERAKHALHPRARLTDSGLGNVVKVDPTVPLELLGALGCRIQTGAGGVLNSLRHQASSSIAVVGTGSVGMSAVMAAAVAGCTTIIAVDLNDQRLQIAEELGATHTVNPSEVDAIERIRQLTGGDGVDFAIETTASPKVLRQAVEALNHGGTCGHIGAAAIGTDVSLPMHTMLFGRSVRGIIQGDSGPACSSRDSSNCSSRAASRSTCSSRFTTSRPRRPRTGSSSSRWRGAIWPSPER